VISPFACRQTAICSRVRYDTRPCAAACKMARPGGVSRTCRSSLTAAASLGRLDPGRGLLPGFLLVKSGTTGYQSTFSPRSAAIRRRVPAASDEVAG
jgi:hypothetical protein